MGHWTHPLLARLLVNPPTCPPSLHWVHLLPLGLQFCPLPLSPSLCLCFFFFFQFHFIYFWLHWVFVTAQGLSLASRGSSSLWSTGFRRTGFSIVLHGLSSDGMHAQQLAHTGSVAPQHVRSSWTRDQTHVHCIGRQVHNHWTTREVPLLSYCMLHTLPCTPPPAPGKGQWALSHLIVRKQTCEQ